MVDPKIEGERVREFRLKLGLNQKQLADKAGLSQPWISMVERSPRYNATMDTAQKLALALGVSVAALRSEAAPPDMTSQEGVTGRSNVGGEVVFRPVLVYGGEPGEPIRSERSIVYVEAHLLHGVEHVVAVRVTTDDLAAWVRADEYAVIDREAGWTDGRVHLFDFGGERLLRQVRVRANVLHILAPKAREDEPDRVEHILPTKQVQLIGVVVVFAPGASRPAP